MKITNYGNLISGFYGVYENDIRKIGGGEWVELYRLQIFDDHDTLLDFQITLSVVVGPVFFTVRLYRTGLQENMSTPKTDKRKMPKEKSSKPHSRDQQRGLPLPAPE